jgi:hypothetical protein
MRVVRDGETPGRKPGDSKTLGVVLVAVFLVTSGYVASWGGWWLGLAIPLMLLGIVGLNEEIEKGPER